MGMAASQARYLALVARKSNCEYEGQQINQARTALSNQSANLFNQMLTLQVPVPPSTQDFTKTQYSYTDGLNASTIDSWQQLATPEEDYNYVVTHHYYTDVYTGSEKKLSDPQVQFNGINETYVTATQIDAAKGAIDTAEDEYDKAVKAYSSLDSYKTETNFTTPPNFGTENKITFGSVTYTAYSALTVEDKAKANETFEDLYSTGALNAKYLNDKSDLYFDTNGNMIFRSEALQLKDKLSGKYNVYDSKNVATKKTDVEAKKNALDSAEEHYKDLIHPGYIGNCELTALGTLTADQEAEIKQIVTDMNKQGITSEITNYYNLANGNYDGGIYSFTMNGVTYYTTHSDLNKSYASGDGINNIDGQIKLPYYNATYVSTKVEKTEKALLETDGNGRFSSIRFEDDSITYTLNMETITDDVAYQDAMNQYYYENAKYDKIIQDINAKTSIIQREDQQLELRLKQLDTEHNALSNEIEAVQKVVKENVEKSFKTFGG